MEDNQPNVIRPKNKAWAIQYFIDTHLQWRNMKNQLTVKKQNEYECIIFKEIEVGRVKIEKSVIIVELLCDYDKIDQ